MQYPYPHTNLPLNEMEPCLHCGAPIHPDGMCPECEQAEYEASNTIRYILKTRDSADQVREYRFLTKDACLRTATRLREADYPVQMAVRGPDGEHPMDRDGFIFLQAN